MSAKALVKQTQFDVEASSAKEAEQIAKDRSGDFIWTYEGVDDDTIEAMATKD
jgi:hypothetical protein